MKEKLSESQNSIVELRENKLKLDQEIALLKREIEIQKIDISTLKEKKQKFRRKLLDFNWKKRAIKEIPRRK